MFVVVGRGCVVGGKEQSYKNKKVE